MINFYDKLLKVIIWIALMSLGLFIIFKIFKYESECIKYESECTCETYNLTAIVTNKEKDERLTCAKPIIYHTYYTVYVTLENNLEIELENETMYDNCKVGDTVTIKVSEKYHYDKFIGTYYDYEYK